MIPINPDFLKRRDMTGIPLMYKSFHRLRNEYLDANKAMTGYLNNIITSGNGFRLPTPDEWELAARWEGYNNEGILIFKNGDSLSNTTVVWTGTSANMIPSIYLTKPKTYSNILGLYEMSGNLREYVYDISYINIPSAYDAFGTVIENTPCPFAQTRGGSFLDNGVQLAISYKMYVDATSYNYFYGFRVAKNKD